MMLHVIGGSYFEDCAEPDRHDFFGSGLRAAAAIAKQTSVRLHTYTDVEATGTLKMNARTFGVQYTEYDCRQTLRFHYMHPLAAPTIFPQSGAIPKADLIELKADHVLCFGMLEGDSVFSAKRAVYDPQSPVAPQLPSATGSQADHLALVLNLHEAANLARLRKRTSPSMLAKKLRRMTGAKAIVIKDGARGAHVFASHRESTVPAFKTDPVWKIGSGDVFAAVFAYEWMLSRRSAHNAAERASRATAVYCEGRILPLPKTVFSARNRTHKPVKIKQRSSTRQHRVYLAGPFFTMAQRWLIGEARISLKHQGVDVFSPLHDVGHGPADHVAPADLAALDKCSAVLAIVDGGDIGTVFEVGYAHARGIPVVAFVQNEHSDALKMLAGSDCQICDDFTTAVYRTVWEALAR